MMRMKSEHSRNDGMWATSIPILFSRSVIIFVNITHRVVLVSGLDLEALVLELDLEALVLELDWVVLVSGMDWEVLVSEMDWERRSFRWRAVPDPETRS